MHFKASELEMVLKDEHEVYLKLYGLEEKKGEAIIRRDGKLIESISRDQEGLLKEIARLEAKRSDILKGPFPANEGGVQGLTLKGVSSEMEGDASAGLLSAGEALRKLLVKTKLLQETNMKLMKDNMEFFRMILAGLKSTGTVSTGYSRSGGEESMMMGPLVFNRKI
jgi:hypothetical protein